MKVLILIHPEPSGRYWFYDIMYKESLADRILRRTLEDDGYEYEIYCPYVVKYKEMGWDYFISGDTCHTKTYFEETGVKGPTDLEGLESYLKRRFENAKILIEGVSA